MTPRLLQRLRLSTVMSAEVTRSIDCEHHYKRCPGPSWIEAVVLDLGLFHSCWIGSMTGEVRSHKGSAMYPRGLTQLSQFSFISSLLNR